MARAVSTREFCRFLLGGNTGAIAMLRAYFDDSGTHQGAPVTLWAGFVGESDVWDDLDGPWRDILEREGISAFHFSECMNGEEEFLDWELGRRDLVLHDFRQLILDRPLFGISIAVSTPDWDEMIAGPLRTAFGNAEQFCVHMCLHDAMAFAAKNSRHHQVAVMLDEGAKERDVTRVSPPLGPHALIGANLVSVGYGACKSIIPLQAADIIVGENYGYAQSWLETGGNPVVRPHFQRFLDNELLEGGIMSRAAIERLIMPESGPMRLLEMSILLGAHDRDLAEFFSWSEGASSAARPHGKRARKRQKSHSRRSRGPSQ